MPRRPVKNPRNLWKPGQPSPNPRGRTPGSPNKINEEVRQAFSMLLAGTADKLQDWLDRTAERHPDKALDIWVKISERFTPALTRTEITGGEGVPFTPITINLPNIPKVSIGEGSPISLPASPAVEVKEIEEGSLAVLPEPEGAEEVREGSPSTDVTPQFLIPKFALSPNTQRDMEKIGGGSLTEFSKSPSSAEESGQIPLDPTGG